MPDLLGYARVSTQLQDLESQKIRLNKQGVIRIFDDVISGRKFERPGLNALIDYARPGDIVCVVRLDRLGRSLKELLETVEKLKQAQIILCRWKKRSTRHPQQGSWCFMCLPP